MTFNMHGVTRGAVQQINKDIPGTIYVSTGSTNVRGILTPTYTTVSALVQVQAQKHNPIRHQVNLQWSNSFLTIYAFGNFSDIERPTGDGGDVVTFTRGTDATPSWYYISQVLEWWEDWCCFEVTRQLNAADLTQFLAQIANGANP